MDLDAVETGGQRIRGAAFKTLDDAGDLFKRQRAGLGYFGERSIDKGLALGADRGRRDRRLVILLQADMRNAPDMPELDEDAPAALVHAVGDLAPPGHLFFRVDAGRVLIALTLLRDLARLGDEQARGCALPVIFYRQRIGHHSGDRAIAGQGRHHQSVRQRKGAKLKGLEEFGRRGHLMIPEKLRVRERWALLPP